MNFFEPEFLKRKPKSVLTTKCYRARNFNISQKRNVRFELNRFREPILKMCSAMKKL